MHLNTTTPTPSVILIGAPGVGKTKLGERVAANRNFDFVDGDRAMIEYIRGKGEVHEGDPVAEKLVQLGDRGFLEYEHRFYLEHFPAGLRANERAGVILSASGSMPLVPETVEHFKNTGAHIVWVTRDTSRIVANCIKRPDGATRVVGLEEHGNLDRVIAFRLGIYRACADSVLDLGTISDKAESVAVIERHIEEIMEMA